MSDHDDAARDAGFQAVLKSLLSAYQPFLERELELACSPEALVKEESARAPSAEEEIALATRLLAPLAHEENAIRILPQDLRDKLGPAEEWRWCILHIRCCLLFGWLVCRRRTFRAFAYYVERYWKCVREIVGTPVHEPPTAEERRDLQILIDALATSFKPYLHGELSSVEAARGVSAELIAGKIDFDEGESATGEIVERLLSADISHALLGSAAIEKQRENPFFVFCRCWCLCAIRLGCCLARARTLVDVLRCLYAYRRCLRDCFRPLFCAITKPADCVSNEPNFDLKALVVPVYGSAGGIGFTHYTLEWSTDNVTFHASDFVYPPVPPGHPTQGTAPVTNGLLAYFDTTLLNPGTYFLRLTVYGQGATQVCEHSFSLFEIDVAIRGADDYVTLEVPDMGGNYVPSNEYDPNAQFVQDVPALCSRPAFTAEMSFGSCLSIQGGAFVGGCDGRRVKRYTLEYKKGFEIDPMTPGWIALSWQPAGTITYATAAQQRAVNDRKGTSDLTAYWGEACFLSLPFPPFSCISSDPLGQLDPTSWTTNETICDISGLITLRLTVEDTLGNLYYDTQRIWLDNKPISASILIDAIPRCGDLFVSQFANPAGCAEPWNVPLRGIAFDELIDEMLAATAPNLNFDRYSIRVEKQGGTEIDVPIDTSDPKNCCYSGISRVGDPGTRCGITIAPPTLGTLAQFDLRTIDPACKSQLPCSQNIPDDFTIARGTCCVYVFKLTVWDRTVSPCAPHVAYADWPVKICNDLP